jgi:hypothetical protein
MPTANPTPPAINLGALVDMRAKIDAIPDDHEENDLRHVKREATLVLDQAINRIRVLEKLAR